MRRRRWPRVSPTVYSSLTLGALAIGPWLFALGVGGLDSRLSVQPMSAAAPATVTARYYVTHVVDGDTIDLDIIGRVRLIGVDTPEMAHNGRPEQPFARAATAFTRKLAEHQYVRLENNNGTIAFDKYGRRLAYIYLPDGSLLNGDLVTNGYSCAYPWFHFSMEQEFRRFAHNARHLGRLQCP